MAGFIVALWCFLPRTILNLANGTDNCRCVQLVSNASVGQLIDFGMHRTICVCVLCLVGHPLLVYLAGLQVLMRVDTVPLPQEQKRLIEVNTAPPLNLLHMHVTLFTARTCFCCVDDVPGQ